MSGGIAWVKTLLQRHDDELVEALRSTQLTVLQARIIRIREVNQLALEWIYRKEEAP